MENFQYKKLAGTVIVDGMTERLPVSRFLDVPDEYDRAIFCVFSNSKVYDVDRTTYANSTAKEYIINFKQPIFNRITNQSCVLFGMFGYRIILNNVIADCDVVDNTPKVVAYIIPEVITDDEDDVLNKQLYYPHNKHIICDTVEVLLRAITETIAYTQMFTYNGIEMTDREKAYLLYQQHDQINDAFIKQYWL